MERAGGPSWIAEAKLRPVSQVAILLGLEVQRDRCGPCPACGDVREKGVRRLPVGLIRGGESWICNRCRVAGDVLDLVAWRLTGGPCKTMDAEGWRTLRNWFGHDAGMAPPSPPGPRTPPPPDYPPVDAIAALWRALEPLSGAATDSSRAVHRWLVQRGLSPDLVADLDLVRCGPVARPSPPPAGTRRVSAPGWPWCAVFPLVDATGLYRSLVFRAVEPPHVGPKSYALPGYERRGLVLADPMACALLSRSGEDVQVGDRTGGPDILWDGVVRLVEGEPDFLTWAADPERVSRKDAVFQTAAVIGWLGSGGLPAEIALRIPGHARVVIYPHQDEAGLKAASQARQRLSHVVDVRKGKV